MSRPLTLLVLGAACAGGAFLISEPEADGLLSREATRLQERTDELGTELRAFTEQQAQQIGSAGAQEWMRTNASALEEAEHRTGISLYAFVNDSLVAWSDEMPFRAGTLAQAHTAQFRVGSSILLHARVDVGSLNVHGLRPIWTSPPILNRYLQEGFHRELHAPAGLRLASSPGSGPLIKDADGDALLSLAWSEGAIELGNWLFWRLALLVLAAGLIVAALWQFGLQLTRSGRAMLGVLIFLGGTALLRWLSLSCGSFAPFDRWPLFDPAIYATSWVFPSLGDLVINATLMLAMAAFLRTAVSIAAPPPSMAYGLAAAGLVLGYAAWVTRLCIGMVSDSSIDLDLFHLQGIGGFGAIALMVMALLFGGWFLVALAAVQLVRPIRSSMQAITIMGIALGVSIVVHQAVFGIVDTLLFLWPLPVILVLWPGRGRAFNFVQAVLAVGFLAGISAHILTKYMYFREQRERVVLAERLAGREDPVVEELFREKVPTLRRDTAVYRLLTSTSVCTPGELESIIRVPYFSGYWDRYDIRLFGFGPQGDIRCATDLEPPRSFDGDPTLLPVGVSDMPDLFIDERSGGELFYHASVAVMPGDSNVPAQLIIEAKPRSLSQGPGFPELLLAGDDDLARRTERYARARYMNGVLVEQSTHAAQAQHWVGALDDEGERWYAADGYDYLAKAVGERTVMVLGLPHRSVVDKATTFSYLFTFFGLLALVVLAVRAVITRSIPSLGIGTKVRAALVLFAIVGLVFFAVGTQRLLTRQFTQRSEAASLEKARSVQSELARRLGDERIVGEANTAYLEHLLGQLGNAFFTDITVYAPDGRLLASSRPQMFSTGLLGQRMDPVAFARMAIDGASSYVHEEKIGTAAFSTAYVPLLDRAGNVLAHIALPRFADQVQQEEERSELLVAIVNLFVLLFVLSVLLAVLISNWTMHPLDLLKRAVAGVALQGANEPIRYRGRDEVGELVAVYNRKVEELRESAEKLARSERESAWKEMARQVAHEIKNPLTPMKLGIQHFQRTWDPGSHDAKERLEQFSRSMVEQIDALSRVAGDFSRFAQMSAANEVVLDLNEVARSAAALFAGEPNAQINVRTIAPLQVRADREHLLRVLNNLLKNALQAVPEGRHARIDVVLRAEAGQAMVEVHDNGAGIPEEVRARIFEPSFTTKSSGMGLGLAMVRRMVEQAGGTVRFETRADAGSTFIVALPLHA